MAGFRWCWILALCCTVAAQPGPAPGPFTAAQAAAGQTIYQVHCATCHLANLGGRNEAPQLAGGNFMNTWRRRSTSDLLLFSQSTMPPSNRGGLGEEAYLNVTAFILEANGATPGTQPLRAATRAAIGSIATGQMTAALREKLNSAATANQAGPPATVAGATSNYSK